jgi:hypothetical protein
MSRVENKSVQLAGNFPTFPTITEWSFEWEQSNIQSQSEPSYLFLDIVGVVFGGLLRVSSLANGTFRISVLIEFVVVIEFTFPASYKSKIKIASSASGHVLTVDGSVISPTYTTGSPTVVIDFPEGWETIQFTNGFSGQLGGVTLEYNGDGIAHWPCDDGEGMTIAEKYNGWDGLIVVGVVDAPIRSNNWEYDTSSCISISPFGNVTTSKIDLLEEPTNEEMCPYRFIDTKAPVFFSNSNWSSVSSDNIERNPDCWMNQEPLTCCSVWSDHTTFKYPATLLSPRHVVLADHISMPNGTELLFIDAKGNRQTTTLIDSELIPVPPQSLDTPDLLIGILADDIALDINFARLLPTNFYTNNDGYGYDVCGLTREGWLDISKFELKTNSNGLTGTGFSGDWIDQPLSKYSRFSLDADDRVGDSDRPQFLFNGDDLFFIGCAYLFQIGNRRYVLSPDVNLTYYRELTQAAMDSLDTANSRTPNYELTIGTI